MTGEDQGFVIAWRAAGRLVQTFQLDVVRVILKEFFFFVGNYFADFVGADVVPDFCVKEAELK
jgi:hypothetical protein